VEAEWSDDGFEITDHYVGYPWILVRMSSIFQDDLRDLLEDAWRRGAPGRLIAEYDGRESASV
jgi:hypothetical protein